MSTLEKQYLKHLDSLFTKIYNIKDKEDPLYYISRYHKEKTFYKKEEQIGNLYGDFECTLFYNDFSEEFDKGLYIEFKGTVYIHKDELITFLDNIEFFCWEGDLDHKCYEKEYYKIRIKRFYYELKTKEIFYM